MSALDDLEPNDEPLDNAGSLLLQLVAAVDYLRRGIRPSFTVWDAFEEALRWHAGIDEEWTANDPLGRVFRLAFRNDDQATAAETFNAALRRWVVAAAAAYNDVFTWELSIDREEPVVWRGWSLDR
jgi:hypothetical protein